MQERFGYSFQEFSEETGRVLREWQREHPDNGRPCIGHTQAEITEMMDRAAQAVRYDMDGEGVFQMMLDTKLITECTKHRGHYLVQGWRRGRVGAEEWQNKRQAKERAN